MALQKIYSVIVSSNWKFMLLCFIATSALYFPARHAMLIDDGLSGLWEIETQGLAGYAHSYGMHEFYYGHYAFLIICNKLFGLNPLPWFFLFCAMHAIAVTLLKRAIATIAIATGYHEPHLLSIIVSAMFLLSPYLTENITWAATSHYAITLSILLWSIQFLCNYIGGASNKLMLLLFHLLNLFALLTLEISFLYVIIYAALFCLLFISKKNEIPIARYFITVLTPIILFCSTYLIVYKINNGNWLPNRCTIENQTWQAKLCTAYQQLVKITAQAHTLCYDWRTKIYNACLHWQAFSVGLAVILLLAIIFLKQRKSSSLNLFLFLLATAAFQLSPFVQKFFAIVFTYENDRYAYFPSVFIYAALAVLLLECKKIIPAAVLLLFFTTSLLHTIKAVIARSEAAALHNNFIATFPTVKPTEKIYLLNVPSYCKNNFLFRANFRLPIALRMHRQMQLNDSLQQVASFYAPGVHTIFETKKLNDSTLQISSPTNGVWWMRYNNGATAYETADYTFTPQAYAVQVHWKHKLQPHEKVFLYSSGQFQEVK